MRGFSAEEAKNVTVCACAANNVMGKAMQGSGLASASVMNCPEVIGEVLRKNDQEARCGTVVFTPGKKATKMQSADEIMDAYFERVKYYTKIAAVSWNIGQQVLMENKPDPCNSFLMSETLERGIDLLRFHKECDTWPVITSFGGINAVNSFAAIQHLVFDQKKYTIEELVQALDANWSGYETMRQDFLNAPKYGNDDDFADDWALRFLVGVTEAVGTVKDAWGYPFTLDGSTATGYTMMGLTAGAGPDGRMASSSLADGSLSPMSGTDNNGPTAVINSAAKLPYLHTELFNQRFMHNFLEGANKEIFAAYLKTWYEKGTISHIQFNVVDSEKLREAKVKPEKHADLIVRVAGYSAHFVDLPDHSQDSIIERTEQAFT
jgi:pyruvate-formate lyase